MEGTENNQGANTQVENVVTQTTGTQNKTEGSVTQTDGKTEEQKTERTFTQTEVNAILTKERKGMPSKEDLEAFNAWKESQKTAEEKQKEELIKMQNLENDKNSQIIEIMKKGIDYDTAEFIQFKLNKMEGNFETNLETYLTQNKDKFKQKEDKAVATTGISQNNMGGTVANSDKAYLDKKYANNPYYKK